MVWIHGGSYVLGGNVQYPGHFLAMFDVVVAVINYSLGNFGFAFTGNDACPGNAGLWDQKMGLEFVVNNIAHFGGDPDQISVVGQSAGATSTGLMMVSPQTKDLFQQGILQSGSETNYCAILDPASNPANYTYQMAEGFGCDFPGDDEAMMDCMRQVDQDLLVYNVSFECTSGYFCTPNTLPPTVDGRRGYLPKRPAELREEGDVMGGPVMTGITRDDGSQTARCRLHICGVRDPWDTELKDHQSVAPTYGYLFNTTGVTSVLSHSGWVWYMGMICPMSGDTP